MGAIRVTEEVEMSVFHPIRSVIVRKMPQFRPVLNAILAEPHLQGFGRVAAPENPLGSVRRQWRNNTH